LTRLELVAALREALGGRRYLMTIGAGVVSTVLLIHGLIGQATWLESLKWTVAVYIAGRTANEVKDVFFTDRKRSVDRARDSDPYGNS
jgi:hypothetical protein